MSITSSSYRINRRGLLIGASAASASLLGGCGNAGLPVDQLRVATSTMPDSLDPARGQFASAALIYKQVHAGLTEYGRNGQLAPGLAERWETTPDGLSWTFILRNGLSWSDGRPLTAHDVAWSARRLVDPSQSFASLGDFQNVTNARAILAGDAPVDSLGVEVVNDWAVRFNLESPLGLFPLLMREFYPFPRHIIERVGNDWVDPDQWVSAGAYIVERVSQTEIHLRKNDYFYDAESVNIARIHVQAIREDATRTRLFRAGDLDLADNPPAQQIEFLRGEIGDQFQSFDAPILRYLKLNHARPELAQLATRQALSQALDRQFLAQQIFAGTASPAAHIVPGSTVPLPDSADRPVLDRPLEIRTTQGLGERLAIAIADDWSRIGVETLINATYPTDMYQAVDAGAFDIAISSFNRGLKADPFFMLDPFGPDGFAANFNWADARFIEQMRDARMLSDVRERRRAYRRAEARLLEQQAVIPLLHERAHWLVSERLQGVRQRVQPQIWRYLSLPNAGRARRPRVGLARRAMRLLGG